MIAHAEATLLQVKYPGGAYTIHADIAEFILCKRLHVACLKEKEGYDKEHDNLIFTTSPAGMRSSLLLNKTSSFYITNWSSAVVRIECNTIYTCAKQLALDVCRRKGYQIGV